MNDAETVRLSQLEQMLKELDKLTGHEVAVIYNWAIDYNGIDEADIGEGLRWMINRNAEKKF